MSNGEKGILLHDTASLLQSLIEGKELEKWQKQFCDVANVFICCVDSHGIPLTEFGGKEDEIERIREAISSEQLQSMLMRVSESTLEDQAIETTAYPNLRLAVVSAKIGGKPVINWLVCGVLSDVTETDEYANAPLEGFTCVLTQKRFEKTIDVLRDITATLLRYKLSKESAEAESRRSRYSEQEMGENLKRSEALTEVVQLLENEEAVETVRVSAGGNPVMPKQVSYEKQKKAVVVELPETSVQEEVRIQIAPVYQAVRNDVEERCFDFLNQAEIGFLQKDQLFARIREEMEKPTKE